MGIFYYWTPEGAQDLYKEVLDEGLKGSGNYGVFGIGAYNGQGMSRFDENSNMHFVMRLELPWKTDSGQIMEAGVQAYTGNYSPYLAPIDTSFGEVVPIVDPANGVLDQRIGGTFVYYPQPSPSRRLGDAQLQDRHRGLGHRVPLFPVAAVPGRLPMGAKQPRHVPE